MVKCVSWESQQGREHGAIDYDRELLVQKTR